MTQSAGRFEDVPSGRQPRAVETALQLLEAAANLGPGVTAQELAREVNLPAATAYRLINILVGQEYLVRLPNLSGFALGYRVAELAGGAHAPVMTRAAKEVLAELRQSTRCGVHLAVYAGRRIHVIDPDPDNPPSHPGMYARFPQAVALGKVAMAELEDWRTMLPGRRLYPATPHTVITEAEMIDELEAVLADGYADQEDELVVGRACLALPIRDGDGRVVAGLAAAGPSSSWLTRRAELISILDEARVRLAPLLS
jgi:DNA-binding IclR family transcriptional regulator